jgi:hypothetical protein
MSGVQGKILRFLGQILRRPDAMLTLDIKFAVLDVNSIADTGLKIKLLKSMGSFDHVFLYSSYEGGFTPEVYFKLLYMQVVV